LNKKTFPPTYLSALLIVEIGLHFLFPIRQIIHAPYTYSGVLLTAISIALNAYFTQYLERQNTTSSFQETAKRLIITGPFSKSRNPIYLSGVLLSFGIAIFLGSLITFFVPISIFLILNSIHIPHEEQRLEEIFGEDYLEYKQQVRRWF
jgi:protein-S-isoprenylcysteine O-methyltransferase Ste14